jgi:glycosyltransferase involved in cell wall biosynthesis
MNFLFVHNNFPAQFRNLAEELAKDPSKQLAAIGAAGAQPLKNVGLHRYEMPRFDVSTTHPFARRFDLECRRAEQVLFAASELAASGFKPDFVIAHCGWGEALPLRAFFPKARIVVYCEFYYRAEGQDVHFDPESPKLGVDGIASLQCKNASTLVALAESDAGLSPTHWQRSTYPAEFQEKIRVAHEGVDLQRLRPEEAAQFTLPGGRDLSRRDEVVTYTSRNLEPLRGYHVFLRAIPEILKARPNAHVVIAGGDKQSYSHLPPANKTWKTFYLDEVMPRLDFSRVHFVDRLPYDAYVRLLQVSSAHVYLTYPFVLSWSLIESMAVGCGIVASDTAPVREAISHRSNGILVPFDDSEALADAVVESLADRGGQNARGRAARETARERYDRTACVQKALAAIGVSNASDGRAVRTVRAVVH